MQLCNRKPRDVVMSPFTVATDTREQAPFTFLGLRADADQGSLPLVIPTETKTLLTGDYSIVGFESQIAIERKSLEDAVSTIVVDRDRFDREFQRMQSYRFAAVVIEASWGKLLTPIPNRRIKPKSITRGIMSLMLRYPTVQWVMCPDRRFAECFTYQLLAKFWEHRQRELSAAAKATGITSQPQPQPTTAPTPATTPQARLYF